MRTKLATYALAGALGLSGVAGAALVAPAVSYAATGDSTALDARVTSLKQALAGLVSDDSITQAQADEIATTIAEARAEGLGRGGHGGGGRVDMGAAAEALGISEEELRTQTQAAGRSPTSPRPRACPRPTSSTPWSLPPRPGWPRPSPPGG